MPKPRTLEIVVHRPGSSAGHKVGTFTGPPPKMRVDLQDPMTWTLKVDPPDNSANFVINFRGAFSPFAGNPVSITNAPGTNATNPLPAVNPGSYIYAVKVTAATWDHSIDHCPEADVGP
jgi:hypothetical protein